jgi:hypothetical protein
MVRIMNETRINNEGDFSNFKFVVQGVQFKTFALINRLRGCNMVLNA